jgi:uncharacterized RDD family membrane protein YckC
MTSSERRDGTPQDGWSPPPAPSPAPPLPPAPPPPALPPPVVFYPAEGVKWSYGSWRGRVLAFSIDALVALIAGGIFASVFRTGDAAPVGELLAVVLLQWMQSKTGATVGKRALGLRLVDLKHGTPPMFVTCVCRWLLHLVDAIFLLGFLAPIVTPRRQTFADMIAKTAVVLA